VIHKDQLSWEITVLALNAYRRPAIEAVLLYQESEESQSQREKDSQKRRDERQFLHSEPTHRPTKKQRRQIHQFKQS